MAPLSAYRICSSTVPRTVQLALVLCARYNLITGKLRYHNKTISAGDTVNLNDLLLESFSVDYKEALETKKPRSWLKSVSASANSFGGHIVFGVRDNPREVCGLDNP